MARVVHQPAQHTVEVAFDWKLKTHRDDLAGRPAPLPLTQRFFDNLFAFLNGINDGVNKGKHEEKPAIIQTYWLQCRP
jgi:hypothetical protein